MDSRGSLHRSSAATRSPPRPAHLVEVTVDDGPARVGIDVVRAGRPGPRGVQPGQRVLHDVLGLVRIAAEQAGRAEQLEASLRDVDREGLVNIHRGAPFHPLDTNQASPVGSIVDPPMDRCHEKLQQIPHRRVSTLPWCHQTREHPPRTYRDRAVRCASSRSVNNQVWAGPNPAGGCGVSSARGGPMDREPAFSARVAPRQPRGGVRPPDPRQLQRRGPPA